MTDKVQKIKDWISKEQDGLMDAQGNFEYPEHEGAYNILCNLDTYIDSMQEEPKPKFEVGQIISKKHNSDINKFGDFRIDSITDGCYWYKGSIICKVSEQDDWEVVEDPVNDEIWNTSKQYALRQVLASTDTKMTEQAYFALNMFSGHELAVAHKDGMLAMKKQMLKDAVEGHVMDYPSRYVYCKITELEEYLKDFKEDDKVKLIVIKDD